MVKIKDITNYLETIAPISYKEDYDNVGLIIGNYELELSGALICLDITKEVLIEAKSKNCNLVISHHPLIFGPLKKITGSNYIEECIIYAIKNDISIYAIHTNIDNTINGFNKNIADLLELENIQILKKKINILKLLTTFVPQENLKNLKESLYKVGAGKIGNYTKCSFSMEGEGTFLPNEFAQPLIGEKNKLQKVNEKRLEIIFPEYLERVIIEKLKTNHPYDKVSYYIQNIENLSQEVGSGIFGELKKEMEGKEFIDYLKSKLGIKILKHTSLKNKKIKKIAYCGGSGSFLIKDSLNIKADIFITADLKYHDFFYSYEGITLCDIGHYESEVLFKSFIFKVLSDNFSNIVLVKCDTVTNPVQFT